MAGTPPTIAMPGYASAGGPGYAGAQIAALEGQLTQFKAKGWTDSHPDVLSVRSQIARLQQQAASDGVGGSGAGSTPNPAYVSMGRSEEHTSELQSLMRISYAVFCLNNKNKHPTDHIMAINTTL